MYIYKHLLFLLIPIYFSSAYADEVQQHVVEPPASTAVFIPLDTSRGHGHVQKTPGSFIPLKARPPLRGPLRKTVAVPPPPPHFLEDPTQKDKNAVLPAPALSAPALPAVAPAHPKAASSLTPQQTQQILSIYGNQH